METYLDWIRVFLIFNKYRPESKYPVSATKYGDEKVYAEGPPPSEMVEADANYLEQHSWWYDETLPSWWTYV